MRKATISFSKQDTAEMEKELSPLEVNNVFKKLSSKVNIDVFAITKEIISKKADGFSINKNNPYIHLYIGNNCKNVSISFATSKKDLKMSIPKIFFED